MNMGFYDGSWAVAILLLTWLLCVTGEDPIKNIREEGDSWEIKCEGGSMLEFKSPVENVQLGIKPSKALVYVLKNTNGNDFVHTYSKANLSTSDAGHYACYDRETKTNKQTYYLYVRSKTQAFVEDPAPSYIIHITKKGKFTIPCRATDPDAQVDLDTLGTLSKGIYDNTKGFEVFFETFVTTGVSVACSTMFDEMNTIVEFVVYFYTDTQPMISGEKIFKLTQTLKVACIYNAELNAMKADAKWIIPNKKMTKLNTTITYSEVGISMLRVRNELTIESSSFDDEGEYQCIVPQSEILPSRSASKNITIIGMDDWSVTLKSRTGSHFFQCVIGETVEWTVDIESYIRPLIRWFKNDQIIYSDERYQINIHRDSLDFKIINTDPSDDGTYDFYAITDYNSTILTIEFKVIYPPKISLSKLRNEYYHDEIIPISYRVMANPPAETSCKFLHATKLGIAQIQFLHDSVRKVSTDVNQNPALRIEPEDKYNVTFYATFKTSGWLICKSCNNVDCGLASAVINITTANYHHGGFVDEPNTRKYNEGEYLELKCVAHMSKFEGISWNSTSKRLTDKLTVQKRSRNRVHSLTFQIPNVQYVDEGNLNCIMKDKKNNIRVDEFRLRLRNNNIPELVASNMNSSMTVDVQKSLHSVPVLYSFFDPRSRPNISWYKNGEIAQNSSELYINSANDTLVLLSFPEDRTDNYICEGRNHDGSTQISQYVFVSGVLCRYFYEIILIIVAIILLLVTICFHYWHYIQMAIFMSIFHEDFTYENYAAVVSNDEKEEIDTTAKVKTYDEVWQFPKEKLEIGDNLGKGVFGVVKKAKAIEIIPEEYTTIVAVKMVQNDDGHSNISHIRALASELKILSQIGTHMNIVGLLGCCTKEIADRQIYAILEYCPFGCLHAFLKRHAHHFINQYSISKNKVDFTIGHESLIRELRRQNSYKTEKDHLDEPLNSSYNSRNYIGLICTMDLLSWSYQTCNGMEFLHSKKVMHSDLSSRNLLLTYDNIIRICDFGLARYENSGIFLDNSVLPVKWMAPEVLQTEIFTMENDIWAFGVTMWEIFSLGELPYPFDTRDAMTQGLMEGKRLKMPMNAFTEIYEIMQDCWSMKPQERLSFKELSVKLRKLLDDEEILRLSTINEIDNPTGIVEVSLSEGSSDD